MNQNWAGWTACVAVVATLAGWLAVVAEETAQVLLRLVRKAELQARLLHQLAEVKRTLPVSYFLVSGKAKLAAPATGIWFLLQILAKARFALMM